MQEIDTLISARWVIPVEPDDRVLSHHSVAIDKGRILDVIPTEDALRKYRPQHDQRLMDHALIPGLINTHTHTSMVLFRGLADDLPLMTWLNDHIWPAESKWVGEEFVADGTRLALAEMMLGGTTCFSDMYFFPDVTARIAAQAGMRAVIGLIVLDFPTVWGDGPDAYLAKGTELHDQYRQHPLVRTAFAPHAPYTVSDSPLERIRVLADELEIPIHMHVHETADEVKDAELRTGERPLKRLQRLGLLSPALVAVHMTQLTQEEIELAVDTGINVVHCPESNLKLASGFCPVDQLVKTGVNLCIGTDGAASNNDLDMFGELRTAALLAKGVAADARALPAYEALRTATINGARALGLASECGSIEKGKSADLTAVDLNDLTTSPVHSAISQLVYATGRHQVSDVWIAGHQVVRERQLTTLDEESIHDQTAQWRQRMEGN